MKPSDEKKLCDSCMNQRQEYRERGRKLEHIPCHYCRGRGKIGAHDYKPGEQIRLRGFA